MRYHLKHGTFRRQHCDAASSLCFAQNCSVGRPRSRLQNQEKVEGSRGVAAGFFCCFETSGHISEGISNSNASGSGARWRIVLHVRASAADLPMFRCRPMDDAAVRKLCVPYPAVKLKQCHIPATSVRPQATNITAPRKNCHDQRVSERALLLIFGQNQKFSDASRPHAPHSANPTQRRRKFKEGPVDSAYSRPPFLITHL